MATDATKRGDAISRDARRPQADRALVIIFITGIGFFLLVGLVYSVAHASQRITNDATSLHDADESLRSATVARAQLALAVHMASVDRALGSSSTAEIAHSVSEARVALSDLDVGIAQLARGEAAADVQLSRVAESFSATGHQIVARLEAGDVQAAQRLSSDALGPEFESISAELVALRDQYAFRIETSDEFLGHVGTVAGFLVAFIIPAVIILIYRHLLVRQKRRADLESRLEAERHVNRAREQFIANASHELRTPLTAIIGLARLLSEDPVLAESDSAADFVDVIVGEADDLARIVEDLLTAAGLDAGAVYFNFEDVELSREAREVSDAMIRAGVEVEVDCSPGLIRADRLRLRQVLRNLLSNARKYGGPSIKVRGRIEGGAYVCSIIDDGDGIDEDIASQLFQRFIHQGKTKPVPESVGLGLSIVKSLVERMGGSVHYEREGGETRFVVKLPLGTEQSGSPDLRDSETDEPADMAKAGQ